MGLQIEGWIRDLTFTGIIRGPPRFSHDHMTQTDYIRCVRAPIHLPLGSEPPPIMSTTDESLLQTALKPRTRASNDQAKILRAAYKYQFDTFTSKQVLSTLEEQTGLYVCARFQVDAVCLSRL